MSTDLTARSVAGGRQTGCGVTRMPLADALGIGALAWDQLVARAGSASPFMSWAWHRAFADSAPPTDVQASEVLALRGTDGSLQALLPLRSSRVRFRRMNVRALTWAIGDTGCPDHLDLLSTPEASISALVPLLEELDWQVIVLSNLVADAPGVRRLCDSLADRGHSIQRQPLWPCPYLELCADWESYLASLSAKRRQGLRYMERSLQRRHAVAITDYDGDRLEEGWDHLVRLHAQRWREEGGAGAFWDPRVDRLHRRFAAELTQRGQLWLTTLDIDGTPAAAWYGFTSHDTVYFYQSGRDPRWERESVGQMIIGAMIRRGMERGYRRFDFLRGEDPYKRQWTTTQRTTEEIRIFRRGFRGRWLRLVDAVASRGQAAR